MAGNLFKSNQNDSVPEFKDRRMDIVSLDSKEQLYMNCNLYTLKKATRKSTIL